MNHNWLKNDVCAGCGTRRDGYGGGRTGTLRYTQPDGTITERAPECRSMGAPCPHASHNCLQCVTAMKSEIDYLKRIAQAYKDTAEARAVGGVE